MNKRITKAGRANNEFKQEWYIAQHWRRSNEGYIRRFGQELQALLVNQWLETRGRWA